MKIITKDVQYEVSGRNLTGFLVDGSQGNQDVHVPMTDLQRFIGEMREAKVDMQVLRLIGARHSFTNPEPYLYPVPGVGYDPVADKHSWQAMKAVLEESL